MVLLLEPNIEKLGTNTLPPRAPPFTSAPSPGNPHHQQTPNGVEPEYGDL